MAKAKREQRERTDNWKQIQQWCRWQEQRLYESIRPVVLYGETPTERAGETSLPERTLRRHADAFDEQGMVVFLRPTRKQQDDMHRSLPVPMRQLIVDLKAEHPEFTLREIAGICYIQFDRRPSHNTVKQVLADGLPPSRTTRQYPYYADMPEPAERRLAVIRLHAQGWSITSIAQYLAVSRPTIYNILKRFASVWNSLFSLSIYRIVEVAFFGSLMFAQIYRYRRVSAPLQRQQTKWVVYAIAIVLVGGSAATLEFNVLS